MEWYQRQWRRNLVDMHIEDWDEEFLSKFDPDEYVRLLKLGNIGAPMLYFQSHVGLCYWPTQSGQMHRGFTGRKDAMKQVERKCHEAGMNVIAYYSLIYNNWAHEKHPEWRMVDVEGRHSRSYGNRYGLCCPNNQEYRAFTERQIQEFCEYFDFEGIFMDMLFWPMVCQCDSCKARWAQEVGGELPRIVDWKDSRWRTFARKRCEWMGDFANWATATIHKYKPGVSVEHQYSTLVQDWIRGVNENITVASTYAGGDLYGGIAQQSFACKAYYGITENQPFEYMTSRCYPELCEHTTNKSMDQLRLSVMMTYLHHGACLLIDAIDPAGTLDADVYRRIGEVFGETRPYEPWLSWGDQAFDVALYFDLNGKYDPEEPPYDCADVHAHRRGMPSMDALLGAARSLRTHHIPYGVVNNYKFDRFEQGKVLVLSDVPDFEDSKAQKVLDYVREGGRLYMSGHTSPRLLREIFGLNYEGHTQESITYISPTEAGAELMKDCFTARHPLVMFEKQARVSGTPRGLVLGTQTLPYTVPNTHSWCTEPLTEESRGLPLEMLKFSSIHSNPPGKYTGQPALVMAEYGKGTAVWCALPIEKPDREQHAEIFARIMNRLCENRFAFEAAAPECVECILFDAPEHHAKVMGLINLQEGFHTQPVYDFDVSIACEAKPTRVYRLPDETPLDFEWRDGKAAVHFDKLHHYAMYVVEF